MELGAEPRRTGRHLEQARGPEPGDHLVQERDLARVQHGAERQGLPLEVRGDDLGVVVELLQLGLVADRLAQLAASFARPASSRSSAVASAGTPSRTVSQ